MKIFKLQATAFLGSSTLYFHHYRSPSLKQELESNAPNRIPVTREGCPGKLLSSRRGPGGAKPGKDHQPALGREYDTATQAM